MIETKTVENIHKELMDMIGDGVGYIDALVEYAKRHDMEIETLGSIIKRSIILKEKIRHEAVGLKLVKEDENSSLFDKV